MAVQIAKTLTVTNLASASGACRFELYGGNAGNQFFIAELELTAAQNAALSTALAATSGTVTNLQFAAFSSQLPNRTNAI